MWSIITYIAIAGIIWVIVRGVNNVMKAEKTTRILGLRKPREYDDFERKSCNQFREECRKHSIDVDCRNMPNLCTYLRILEMKGMHIELIKDGLVRYDYSDKNKFDTEAWIQKWNRIVFSPNISAENICKCIRTIMKTHGLSEFENRAVPSFPGNDGLIKPNDSFFIFRALHMMHYLILIQENNVQSKAFEINNPKLLLEKNGCPVDDVHELKPLKELANVKTGIKIWESDIRTIGNYPPIIYLHNILAGPSELKYYGGATEIDTDFIVLGLKPPFDMKIWEEQAVIAEGIAGIEVTVPFIHCEYLFLFLKLVCHKFLIDGANEIKEDNLKAIDIVVIPTHIQREIIRKGMPVKDDIEQLKSVFNYYHQSYPLLRTTPIVGDGQNLSIS